MRQPTLVALADFAFTTFAVTTQGYDPIKNFCARFDHQSIIKDETLYIYGGGETFVGFQNNGSANGSVVIGYNDYMININLTSSWDWKNNISETTTNITANTDTGSLPPQVVRGTLYQGAPSDSRIFLYGGTTSYANTSFPGWQNPDASTYSLWSFDPDSTTWDQYTIGSNATYRPSSGAAAEASDQGLAFYFNGLIDNGSSSETVILGVNNVNVFLPGMIVINTTDPDQTTRNLSTSALTGNQARARGKMQYVPNVGKNGILVQLGGSSKAVSDLNDLELVNLIPMNEVGVFDIASLYNTSASDGTWYIQNTTSTAVPAPRVDFCLLVASAPDSSSHNIYMYGGRDADNNYFDEVWILSLPSFTWILAYTGQSPRFSHTCHLAGTRTMLTVGGVASESQFEGLPGINVSPCDWEVRSIGVLDMSNITWGSVYNAEAPPYEVPVHVVSIIGGFGFGNATMKAPTAGFAQDGLARLFGVSPESSKASSSSHRTAEIAGPICVVIGLVLLATGFTWLIRKYWPGMEISHAEEIHEKGASDVPEKNAAREE